MSTDLDKSTSNPDKSTLTFKHSKKIEELAKKFEANGWTKEGESRIHIAYSFDIISWRKRQQETAQSAADSNSNS